MPRYLVEIPVRVSLDSPSGPLPKSTHVEFRVDADDAEEAVEVIGMLLANLIDTDELEDEDGPPDVLS